jgi:hypothetical protein
MAVYGLLSPKFQINTTARILTTKVFKRVLILRRYCLLLSGADVRLIYWTATK